MTIQFTEKHIDFIKQYGGLCRDCADENGICPYNGLPCEDRDKPIRYVLNALTYGLNHKMIPSPFTKEETK